MPPKKVTKKVAPKLKAGPRGMAKPIPAGLVMTDLMKKQWKLGPVIGQGGFGYIYLGAINSSAEVATSTADHVIKVEPHANGPLFVELHFYQRVAKAEMINTWLKKKKKTQLGLPLFIGTGSFDYEGNKYRFMVMDRYSTDLEKIYVQNNNILPEKTVYSLGLRIVDVLEYLHDNEYAHADIKSSNLMMGYKKGETSKVYLLDYGLAYRFSPGGVHVPYKEDPKRRHDGTVEFTSRDAHKGLAPSRRGDMEILAYCMVQWLCSKLPWEDKLQDKDYVFKQKEKYMSNIKEFMSKCFGDEVPGKLKEYLELVTTLDYTEKPDYDKVRNIFEVGLKQCGCANDGKTVYLPAGKSPAQRAAVGPASSKKPRIALKDLPSSDSPRKAGKPSGSDNDLNKKRGKSPAKVTPRKRIKSIESLESPPVSPATVRKPEASPVKKVRAAVPVRRSPRRAVRESNSSSDEGENTRIPRGNRNGPSVGAQNLQVENKCSDRVVVVDGVEKVIHRRVRKKNVPTRDFAQSP